MEELLFSSDPDFLISVNDPNRILALQAGVVRSGGGSFYGQKFTIKSGVKIVFEISNRANGK